MEKHNKDLRKSSLLQAASTLFEFYYTQLLSHSEATKYAINRAFQLEKDIENELKLRG